MDIISFLEGQLKSNQFMIAGLVVGALTTIVYSLKSVPIFIWDRVRRRIVFEVTVEQTDELHSYLQKYLNDKYGNQLRNVKASFNKSDGYSNYPTSSNKLICNHYGDQFEIWFNYRLLRFSAEKDKMENANNINWLYFEKYRISGLFAKKAIMQLLDTVIVYNVLKKKEERIIYAYNNTCREEWNRFAIKFRTMSNIFIDDSVKNDIINDAQNFLASKSFYELRGIPYRRGYLLHGPPGTGKSSFFSAFANLLKRDIYIMNLKQYLSESDFVDSMIRIKSNSILLIEDIDAAFQGRKEKTKISFSTFINELSGVSCKEDIILCITTNNLEALDSALIRPGRIDMIKCFGYSKAREINDYFEWFYGHNPQFQFNKEGISMASIENICIQNKYDYEAAKEQTLKMLL